jgi:hypothetical protein
MGGGPNKLLRTSSVVVNPTVRELGETIKAREVDDFRARVARTTRREANVSAAPGPRIARCRSSEERRRVPTYGCRVRTIVPNAFKISVENCRAVSGIRSSGIRSIHRSGRKRSLRSSATRVGDRREESALTWISRGSSTVRARPSAEFAPAA